MALYALHIVATGEVRDRDGNLVETIPIDEVQEVELSDEQYRQITNQQKEIGS